MYLLKCLSALLVAALVSDGNALPLDNCTASYQAALKEALTIKEECQGAAFYDCCQVKAIEGILHFHSAKTGLYEIAIVCEDDIQAFLLTPTQPPVMQARCDMEADSGGWTVILRRKSDVSPPVNFYRNWKEYENGFGDLNTEFWYGLRNMHCLTSRDTMQLRVELNHSNGTGLTWTYQHFRVDGPANDYRLQISAGEGPSGVYDALRVHNGARFSTFDNDNDNRTGEHCARNHRGGWWLHECYHAGCFLTGHHTATAKVIWDKINWYNGRLFPQCRDEDSTHVLYKATNNLLNKTVPSCANTCMHDLQCS